MTIKPKRAATLKREDMRLTLWPEDEAWSGTKTTGWFASPRTLPLLLGLMAQKEISGAQDPTRVYLELLSRHFDSGFIEMSHERDHAYAAGYWGERGLRTWEERMHVLRKAGFIKVKPKGARPFGFVLLVPPATVVESLCHANKVPQVWLDTYRTRQIETGEAKSVAAEPTTALVPAAPRVARFKRKPAVGEELRQAAGDVHVPKAPLVAPENQVRLHVIA